MTSPRRPELLHVASPIGVQHATNSEISATKSGDSATANAATSLKALAGAVLQKVQPATAMQPSSEISATNSPENDSKSCTEIARVASKSRDKSKGLDADAHREAEHLGILPIGSRQKIKFVRCLDCGFDSAYGIRCKAGAQRTVREHSIRLCTYFSRNPKELTPEQEQAIRGWLQHIGETKDFEINKVLAKCQGEPEALEYYLQRAEEV